MLTWELNLCHPLEMEAPLMLRTTQILCLIKSRHKPPPALPGAEIQPAQAMHGTEVLQACPAPPALFPRTIPAGQAGQLPAPTFPGAFSPTNKLQNSAGTESETGIVLLSIPWEFSSLLGENSPSQLHQDLRIRAG